MSTAAVRSRAPWWALAALVLAATSAPASAQCTFGSAFGSATINLTGTVVQISTCSFAGEYSTISGAVAGQTLQFASSVATDFITIHSGTPAGPVVAFGTTPLSFANTFTGTLYAHWAANAACGTQNSCRTTTVQCTSCTPPPAPANDACASATVIGSPSATPGTTVSATSDTVPTCTTTLNTAPGVWYSFTPCASGSFTASLCGAGYDTKIGVFTGGCGGLTCVIGNDDFCGLQSQATFSGTAGTTYLILVTGFSTNSGAFTLNMTGDDLCNACSLTCPANQIAGTAPGTCAATVAYPAPTAAGNCGAVTCTPPSGGTFNLGTTPVGCASALNGGACGFNVTVNDNLPPSITAPANQTIGTDAPACSAVGNYPAPTAADNCPGVGTVCNPPAGSTFPLGPTTVTCTATDGAGNTATASFSETVVDDDAPAQTACPADIVVDLPPGGQSTTVDFAAPTATDNCSASPATACVPPAGDPFPPGTTTVACTSSDGAGNDATCAFDVVVGNQTIQEIPAASTLGLAALALLLGAAAFVALRRGA